MSDLGGAQQWEKLLGFQPKIFEGCNPSGDAFHAMESQNEEAVSRLDITDENSVTTFLEDTAECAPAGMQDRSGSGPWRTTTPPKRPRPSPDPRSERSRQQSMWLPGDTGSSVAPPHADEVVEPEALEPGNSRGQIVPPDSGGAPLSETPDIEATRSCLQDNSHNREKANVTTGAAGHEQHDAGPEEQHDAVPEQQQQQRQQKRQQSHPDRDSDEKQEDGAHSISHWHQ